MYRSVRTPWDAIDQPGTDLDSVSAHAQSWKPAPDLCLQEGQLPEAGAGVPGPSAILAHRELTGGFLCC